MLDKILCSNMADVCIKRAGMANWDSWTFSVDNRDKVDEFFKKHSNDSCPEDSIGKQWFNLFNSEKMEGECSQKEKSFNDDNCPIDYSSNLLESLENGCLNLETIPDKHITAAFKKLSEELESLESFCRAVLNLGPDCKHMNIILEFVILPQILKKAEVSSCIIHYITDLTKSYPNQVYENLLVPIASSENINVDLMSNVFPNFKPNQQDAIILSVIKKSDISENDWTVLQALLKIETFSCSFFKEICLKVNEKASNFKNSQSFSKFLLFLAKSNLPLPCRESLSEAAKVNQTLLKKQILKYLNV